MASYEIDAQTAQVDVTPYYMATLACDVFNSAKAGHTNAKHGWYKYFLYCVAIELGLKAILLNDNNTPEQKKRNKDIGHDLTLLRGAIDERLSQKILDDQNEEAIDQMSPFFRSKSLEYVSGELLEAILSGGKDLPSIDDLEGAANKIVKYIVTNGYLVNSDTRT